MCDRLGCMKVDHDKLAIANICLGLATLAFVLGYLGYQLYWIIYG